jgi:hypothetical protein
MAVPGLVLASILWGEEGLVWSPVGALVGANAGHESQIARVPANLVHLHSSSRKQYDIPT